MNYNARIERFFGKITDIETKKLAVYPFGTVGSQLVSYINKTIRREGYILVDNQKCDGENIYSISDVPLNGEDYYWLVACADEARREEIISSITNKGISSDFILDFFDSFYDANDDYFSIEIRDTLEEIKSNARPIVVAEIGIDKGETSLQICKRLNEHDVFYFFDFDDKCQAVRRKLQEADVSCELISVGNGLKKFDSYVWGLSDLLLEINENNENGLFDLAYLDGAHDLFHDGTACCLIKELLKPNGYVVFDDVDWTIARSPTCNPSVNPNALEMYTLEQIEDRQIDRVIRCFMKNDARFEQIKKESWNNNHRAVFRKVLM